MLCFSMYRNLKRLVSTDADEHHLKSMHGIKLYSMACVMLGHRLMFSLGSPIHNPEFIEGASTHRIKLHVCVRLLLQVAFSRGSSRFEKVCSLKILHATRFSSFYYQESRFRLNGDKCEVFFQLRS